MTAGERLRALAGVGGTAGALLLLIGSGATAGAVLVDYSGLPTATAAVHLMTDVTTEEVSSIRNFDYDDYSWARVHRKKEVEEVIEQIALRQSEHLLTDEQKIFDELTRELELKGLEFKAIHLKALNYRREQLINAEIGKLIKARIQEEDEMLLMLIAMSI